MKSQEITAAVMAVAMMFSAMPAMASATPFYPELGLNVSDTVSNGYSYVFNIADAVSPRMKEGARMVRLAESGTEYKYNVGLAEWESGAVIDTFGRSEVCTLRDANCNGTVDVADVVAVLQYMTNSTKYQFSEQGKTNADIDGEEGITGGRCSGHSENRCDYMGRVMTCIAYTADTVELSRNVQSENTQNLR